MKNIRFVLFAVFAVISVAAPLSIIGKHEAALRYGVEYKFRTQPVDPYDAFRGRYVTLGFENTSLKMTRGANDGNRYRSRGELYYVRLGKDAQGFAVPVEASRTPLKGGDVITVDNAWFKGEDELQLDYPFNRYYLPEDIAPQAEQLYRAANRRGANDDSKLNTYVTVRVRGGVGILDELYLNGKPVREAVKDELAKGR